MCKHICCIGNIFNNILTTLSSGTVQARTGLSRPAIKFRRQLLSIYALDHPYKFLIATFGCSRHDIAMARQHALEHGPGQEAPVEVHTRPGRTIEAGFYEIVSFIGNPENLHRLPSTQGKGITDEYILLKRTRLRSKPPRSVQECTKPPRCPYTVSMQHVNPPGDVRRSLNPLSRPSADP
jgi:hypothetical protein